MVSSSAKGRPSSARVPRYTRYYGTVYGIAPLPSLKAPPNFDFKAITSQASGRFASAKPTVTFPSCRGGRAIAPLGSKVGSTKGPHEEAGHEDTQPNLVCSRERSANI